MAVSWWVVHVALFVTQTMLSWLTCTWVRLTKSKNDSHDEQENGSSESEASEYYVKIVPIQIHHISFIHMPIKFRNFIGYWWHKMCFSNANMVKYDFIWKSTTIKNLDMLLASLQRMAAILLALSTWYKTVKINVRIGIFVGFLV